MAASKSAVWWAREARLRFCCRLACPRPRSPLPNSYLRSVVTLQLDCHSYLQNVVTFRLDCHSERSEESAVAWHVSKFWEGPDFSRAAKSLKMYPRFSARCGLLRCDDFFRRLVSRG